MHQDLKEIYDNIFLPSEGKRQCVFRKFFHISKKVEDFRKKIDLVYTEYKSINGSYIFDSEIYAEAKKNFVEGYSNNMDPLI